MALTVSSMNHSHHHDMNGHSHPFAGGWPQAMNMSSSAPVDAYVQSGSPPSPSAHLGHGIPNAYYDDTGGGSHLLDMAANGRNYLLSGTGSPPTGGMGQDGRQQRSGSGTRTPSRNSSQDQYSAQLYKTELCRSFKETGYCRYGLKCRFAHGTPDLRPVQRHKKYKTEKCKNYQRDGNCPYGERCRFLHEDGELEELLLAEQMDGLVRETVSGTGSNNTSMPASPYIGATGSSPTEHDFASQHLLYDSPHTSSRFNATKPIPSRGSLLSNNNHPYNPYSSQSVPTNMDLHPSLVYGRRPADLTTSASGDFSYGSPHITYDADDEVLGRMEGMDDDGWMTRHTYKQKDMVRQQQAIMAATSGGHEHDNHELQFTSHQPFRVGHSTSSDELTDDVMDVHSAVRSAFAPEIPATTYHSQSTPASLGSTPTGQTRSPLILSSVPKSPIIGPSVWSTTASEIRTSTSTPGQATPTTGFAIPQRPTSSSSIPSSSTGSPFFSALLPPTSGRSSNPMPAFSLSSSAQPIPVSHMRSTSGNLSRTQALAMEMAKGGVPDDEEIHSARRHKKQTPSGTISSLLNRNNVDTDDVDELDLHSLMIDSSHPSHDDDVPINGRFRSISLNLPNTTSQAIAISTSTSTSTTSSWYGSQHTSPTSQHHSPAHHSFSLPSAVTSRGLPSPLQRLNAPLQTSSINQHPSTTTTTTSGSTSPAATPSSPHGPIGSAPSSASSASRRLRLPIFANLSTTTPTNAATTTTTTNNHITNTDTPLNPVLGTPPSAPSTLVSTDES